MRKLSLKTLTFLSLLFAPGYTFADIIGGTSPGRLTSIAVADVPGTPLFDVGGSSLLFVSPPHYLDLSEPREKLRLRGAGYFGLGTDGLDFSPAGIGSFSPISSAVLPGLNGLNSGINSTSLGNGSFSGGPKPENGGPNSGGTSSTGSGSTSETPSWSESIQQVPEPSSFLLVATGLSLGVRRWMRRRR